MEIIHYIFSHDTESSVNIEKSLTEGVTELEHFDSAQPDHRNISKKTARVDISESLGPPEGESFVEDEKVEAIKTKEISQLMDVNDEIIENYDSLESLKSNGEVEPENQEKEKEKEKFEIKVKPKK